MKFNWFAKVVVAFVVSLSINVLQGAEPDSQPLSSEGKQSPGAKTEAPAKSASTVPTVCEPSPKNLSLYPVSSDLMEKITTIARETDVLMLGECHGTQEVAGFAASLIPQLSTCGYKVLALEVACNELKPLVAWASGETEEIPEFFAKPICDGRDSAQMLELIRLALSPRHGWKLICFDRSSADMLAEYEKMKNDPKIKQAAFSLEVTDEQVETWQKRDAFMAEQLTSQLKPMPAGSKVLAICGSAHNRIENKGPMTSIPGFARFWPSFAAVLQQKSPDLKVRSVNVVSRNGAFFNFRLVKFGGHSITEPEIHAAPDTGYHWGLNLPHATAATFLALPRFPLGSDDFE